MSLKLITVITLTAASLLFGKIETADAALVAPFDVDVVHARAGAPDKKPFACDSAPIPAVDLHFESMYQKGDKSASVVDPAAQAAYDKAVKPVNDFEKHLSTMASRYSASSPPRADIAACTLEWLDTWAKAGALMGDVNKNGEYIRKWVLATVANAYMQVRREPTLDSAKKAEILSWIGRVTLAARDDFSRDPSLKSRQNNHLYWAAWGVASGAMAVGDKASFDWAMDKARFGIDQVQDNGALPLELMRKKRALRYHNFASMPLFFLAEAGYRNGVDLFKYNNAGLKRLGRFTLESSADPDKIAALAGEKQEMNRAVSASNQGWLEIYDKHYPGDPMAKAALEKFRPMKMSRMGGNITLLYALKTGKDTDASEDDDAPMEKE